MHTAEHPSPSSAFASSHSSGQLSTIAWRPRSGTNRTEAPGNAARARRSKSAAVGLKADTL